MCVVEREKVVLDKLVRPWDNFLCVTASGRPASEIALTNLFGL